MDQKKRTRLLAGILAAVVGIGVMRPVVTGPIDEAGRSLERAKEKLELAKEKDFELDIALNRLDNARLVSLPPSENDARRLYQEWITDLATECSFAQPKITPRPKDVRSGKYLSVGVDVASEASLKDLSRFLFLFDQADFLHRISSLRIKSTGTSENPRLEFTLSAQALSANGSPDKSEIVARTELTQELSTDAQSLSVPDADGFPKKAPFLAKIGPETVEVTDVSDNNWTVKRGIGGRQAEQHNAGTIVQHFPVVYDRRNRTFDEYQSFLEQSLFTKPSVPREYKPELVGLSDQIVEPGNTATVTARVDDYNVDLGEVEFALKDAPDGMKIDPVTGQIRLETTKDTSPAKYTVTVLATQKGNPDLSLSGKFELQIRLPNAAPTLTLDESAVVLLGRSFELQPTAVDDGDVAELTFAFEGDVPEGLTVDEKSGALRWSPPPTFSPGTHNVQLKVTDKGDPPQSSTKTVSLTVKDDDAKYTRLTSIVGKDGVISASFHNQRTKSYDVYKVGDSLEIADIKATIIQIEPRLVKLQDDKGVWLLALGNQMRDRVLREPAASPAEKPSNPPEAEAAEQPTPDAELP